MDIHTIHNKYQLGQLGIQVCIWKFYLSICFDFLTPRWLGIRSWLDICFIKIKCQTPSPLGILFVLSWEFTFFICVDFPATRWLGIQHWLAVHVVYYEYPAPKQMGIQA